MVVVDVGVVVELTEVVVVVVVVDVGVVVVVVVLPTVGLKLTGRYRSVARN